jgi:phage baseplate assembly protein W
VIRARRLKRRVAELVDVAAHRAGLQRIARRTRRAIRRAEAAARLAKVDSVNA